MWEPAGSKRAGVVAVSPSKNRSRRARRSVTAEEQAAAVAVYSFQASDDGGDVEEAGRRASLASTVAGQTQPDSLVTMQMHCDHKTCSPSAL